MLKTRLEELIPPSDSSLISAARYSLLSSGKRIRPLLTLAAASAFGADPSLALDPACALEMIHTYSLIHDDLPSMDNDDLRRGKPTLHKVYPEGVALLAGDYLLTFAFEVLANAPGLSSEQRVSLIQTVSLRAGSKGMIGGQAIDIESEGKKISEELLISMHQGKTAALFSACLECGAIVANAAPSAYPLLQSIAQDLGLAYQFLDDLLDATSTTPILGKNVGADAAKKKPTAVSLFGIEKTKMLIHQLKSSLSQKMEQLSPQTPDLQEIVLKIFASS
jgi:geranylgeranyl pyrophosphate synthase